MMGGFNGVQNWVKKQHNRFTSVQEQLYTNQGFDIEEELLNNIRSCQHSKMMLNSFNLETLISSLVIPVSCNPCPNFSILEISFLNSHPISGKITETLNPCILKGWNTLHKQSHNRIGYIDEGKHVV